MENGFHKSRLNYWNNFYFSHEKENSPWHSGLDPVLSARLIVAETGLAVTARPWFPLGEYKQFHRASALHKATRSWWIKTKTPCSVIPFEHKLWTNCLSQQFHPFLVILMHTHSLRATVLNLVQFKQLLNLSCAMR